MIRLATHDDIETMLKLGRAMHSESTKFRGFTWSDEKVRNLIGWLIDNEDGFAVVADRNGVVVGGFLGMVIEEYFSYDKRAQDFALFVSQDHRGALIGRQLVKAFAEWGMDRCLSVDIGVSTKVNAEATCKLLEASGFERYGFLYEYKGN